MPTPDEDPRDADVADDALEPETTTAAPVVDDPTVVAGRYAIQRVLGRGGGGIVWLAVDQHLGREVALKKVAGEADADVLVTRGLREARTSAALAHDHVVRVYDAFEHEGAPWIVMEYVPGPSLASLLEDGRSLPPRQVAAIGAQVATALAAAHGAGILHRDVKPGNVLLADESGRNAKLTDFGIARGEDDHQLTRTGMVSGTAAYFSPEIAQGGDPSPASDVWALGATLYAAVEGRRPFPDAANAVAQLHTIVRETPLEPRRAGPLTTVLAGMLHADPEQRWSAERAARALSEVASGTGGGTAAEASAAAAGWAAQTGPHQPVPTTRDVPVTATAQHRPDGQPQTAPAVAPTARHGQSPASPAATARPPHQPRPRRGAAGLLGWLLAIPLALLLAWLVWTIATQDGGLAGGTDPTDTEQVSEQPQNPGEDHTQRPVTAQEAEDLVTQWYKTLKLQGLPEARKMMLPGAAVDEAIAEDLASVKLDDLTATEQGDGSTNVDVTVSYKYGPNRIVQREHMIIVRQDGQPKIASRSTETLSENDMRDD